MFPGAVASDGRRTKQRGVSTVDILQARLAARGYRNARFKGLTSNVDEWDAAADRMATQIESLPTTFCIVEPCHDDSEECHYCAFPEHAPVVLIVSSTLGTVPVCRDHVESALAVATGATFDRGEVPDAPDPTTWLCIECGSLIPLGTETSPRHAARCSLHVADTNQP